MDTANQRASSQPTNRYQAHLFIAGGESAAGATEAIFALDEPCGTCIVSTPPTIATLAPPRGWRDPVLALLRGRLDTAHGGAAIATPPAFLRGLAPRPGEWIEVDLSARGERLNRIVLARSLFDSEMLFGYSHLDRPLRAGEPPAVAIGLWRTFARSWERLGARLGEEGASLAADIALGVVVRRYYVAATLDGMTVLLASSDPIVAEIAGRALLRLRQNRDNDMMVVPWEEPLVQRAAELRLGVRTPEEIRLSSRWNGSGARQARFDTLIRNLADLISVTELTDERPVPATDR
jgi:hypothetical protein